MDLLCQFQADVLGVEVRRSAVRETTALGAAFLAGIAEGVWDGPDDIASKWSDDGRFTPAVDPAAITAQYEQWHRAVDRSRNWATDEPTE